MAIIGGDYGYTLIWTDGSESEYTDTDENTSQIKEAWEEYMRTVKEIDRIKANRKIKFSL